MYRWLLIVSLVMLLFIAGCDPGDTPEEEVCEIEDFKREISINASLIAEDLAWLGDHIVEYTGTDVWYEWAEEAILDLIYWFDDAGNIEPPPEMQGVYDHYMLGINEYDNSMNLLLEVLETWDDAKFDKAIEKLETGNTYIREATAMLE